MSEVWTEIQVHSIELAGTAHVYVSGRGKMMQLREGPYGTKHLEFDESEIKHNHETRCTYTLQQSVVEEECIYFEIKGVRMYLSREHVEELLPLLSRFVGTGNLGIS